MNRKPTAVRQSAKAPIAAAAALLLAAAPAAATPSYTLLTTLPIPGVTTFTGYDAATFDNSTQLYYLTDRSNNAVDVYSGATNSFVKTIGSGLFAGTTGGDNDTAGPNGIAIATVAGGGKVLVAGNGGPSDGMGGSTGNIVTFNLAPNGLTTIGSPTIVSTATATTPSPTLRVDGVAYSPTLGITLAANNSSNPGFITLANSTGVTHTILLNGSAPGIPNVGNQGVEGTIWNAATGTFFVALPALSVDSGSNPLDAGGVIEVDPNTGAILHTYNITGLTGSSTCSPTGLVQGAGNSFLVACSDPHAPGSYILNVAADGTGSLTLVPGITGSDQDAYDPTLNTYFESDRDSLLGPTLGIIDASTLATQTLPIGANDHSVTVDSFNNEAWVATGPTNTLPGCTNGCIAIFTPVPEPSTLALALLPTTLAAFALTRRRR